MYMCVCIYIYIYVYAYTPGLYCLTHIHIRTRVSYPGGFCGHPSKASVLPVHYLLTNGSVLHINHKGIATCSWHISARES